MKICLAQLTVTPPVWQTQLVVTHWIFHPAWLGVAQFGLPDVFSGTEKGKWAPEEGCRA